MPWVEVLFILDTPLCRAKGIVNSSFTHSGLGLKLLIPSANCGGTHMPPTC